MKNMLRPVILLVVVCVLLLGIWANVFLWRPSAEQRQRLPVDILPRQAVGYTVTDLPIADTEMLQTVVKNELGYDDYVYRNFESSGRFFTIYLCFWRPERRHFFDIGTHAPDNCWVQNGWNPHPKRPYESFPGMRPAESRLFDKCRVSLDVYYWHLVGSRLINYGRYGRGRTLGFLFDNMKWSLSGRDEQYFLRISTNIPATELKRDPAFQDALGAISHYVPLKDIEVNKALN